LRALEKIGDKKKQRENNVKTTNQNAFTVTEVPYWREGNRLRTLRAPKAFFSDLSCHENYCVPPKDGEISL